MIYVYQTFRLITIFQNICSIDYRFGACPPLLLWVGFCCYGSASVAMAWRPQDDHARSCIITYTDTWVGNSGGPQPLRPLHLARWIRDRMNAVATKELQADIFCLFPCTSVSPHNGVERRSKRVLFCFFVFSYTNRLANSSKTGKHWK